MSNPPLDSKTVVLSIAPASAEKYRILKNELYAWQNDWRQAIILAFTSTLPAPQGSMQKTMRVLVTTTTSQALAALPEGVTQREIAALEPVSGLVADVVKPENYSPWKPVGPFVVEKPVYCFPQGADQGQILVTGLDRETKKYVTQFYPIRRLTGWRVESVALPIVIFEWREKGGWTGKPEESAVLKAHVARLGEGHE